VARTSARSLSVLIAGLSAIASLTLAALPAGAGGLHPTPTFTQAPPSITNSTTATFAYDLHGGTRAICHLDAAPFAVCDPSTMTYSGLAAGGHTFEVLSSDQAGGSATATYTWTIDLTAPDTTITSQVDAAGNLRLAFTSTERGSTFQCKVVRVGRWARCESVVTIPLADLPLEVRAVDRAGNVDRTPASILEGPRH
jgi:large repetitive protein